MKVTLDHPEAKRGYPVILDDDGHIMQEHDGIEAALRKVNLSPAAFAAFCGILPTTLARYGRQSRAPGHVLNALGMVLKTKGAAAKGVSSNFTKNEREILCLRAQGKTFTQIAKILRISRQRAHQIAQAADGKRDLVARTDS